MTTLAWIESSKKEKFAIHRAMWWLKQLHCVLTTVAHSWKKIIRDQDIIVTFLRYDVRLLQRITRQTKCFLARKDCPLHKIEHKKSPAPWKYIHECGRCHRSWKYIHGCCRRYRLGKYIRGCGYWNENDELNHLTLLNLVKWLRLLNSMGCSTSDERIRFGKW